MEEVIIKKEPSKISEQQLPLIIFKLGSEEYGIKIEQVKEVTITPKITPMPKTPGFIRGVTNIRGEIIAVVDLEEKFNIRKTEKEERSKHTYTLVVERENFTIGIIVKEVPQTLTLSASQIDKSPTLLHDFHINEKFIDGIGKVGNRLIILLDIHKILNFEEEKSIETMHDPHST